MVLTALTKLLLGPNKSSVRKEKIVILSARMIKNDNKKVKLQIIV